MKVLLEIIVSLPVCNLHCPLRTRRKPALYVLPLENEKFLPLNVVVKILVKCRRRIRGFGIRLTTESEMTMRVMTMIKRETCCGFASPDWTKGFQWFQKYMTVDNITGAHVVQRDLLSINDLPA